MRKIRMWAILASFVDMLILLAALLVLLLTIFGSTNSFSVVLFILTLVVVCGLAFGALDAIYLIQRPSNKYFYMLGIVSIIFLNIPAGILMVVYSKKNGYLKEQEEDLIARGKYIQKSFYDPKVYCPLCGNIVKAADTYCVYCGKKLPKSAKPAKPAKKSKAKKADKAEKPEEPVAQEEAK